MSHEDFAQFYEQHYDRVYGYALHRAGSTTRADEIVSDAFSRALKSWDGYDPRKGDRQAWLFGIAFRCVADSFRASSRSGAPLDSIPEPAGAEPGPAESAERAQELNRLGKALAGLEPQAREIVALRFFAGLTNRAIAGVLGLSESNVAVILFRSVRRMRKDFTGVEADHG
jgi:RNA polymerase sigma factor (sigma-70 family)